MTGVVVRRILSSILVVVLTSMFVFVLVFLGLGDRPAVAYCHELKTDRCTPIKLEEIKREMGYRHEPAGVVDGQRPAADRGRFAAR